MSICVKSQYACTDAPVTSTALWRLCESFLEIGVCVEKTGAKDQAGLSTYARNVCLDVGVGNWVGSQTLFGETDVHGNTRIGILGESPNVKKVRAIFPEYATRFLEPPCSENAVSRTKKNACVVFFLPYATHSWVAGLNTGSGGLIVQNTSMFQKSQNNLHTF